MILKPFNDSLIWS